MTRAISEAERRRPAYYNENDHAAAEWLRALIAAGLIPDGDVDERSIADVQPGDLAGYDQCHFFAGIGGWPYSLRLAGWRGPVWTGSCPCQPLSGAGQRKGHADQRHLWPAFHRLIAECRPATVFGEQVAGKDGREWLAGVRADLEGAEYAVGAADLCAAGVGAPHIRQRLFWVADAGSGGVWRRVEHRSDAGPPREDEGETRQRQRVRPDAGADGGGLCGATGGLADASGINFAASSLEGRQAVVAAEPGGAEHRGAGGVADAEHAIGRPLDLDGEHGRDGTNSGRTEAHGEPGARSEVRGLADAASRRRVGSREDHAKHAAPGPLGSSNTQYDRLAGEGCALEGSGFWADAVWLACLDGKARRVEPGIQCLAHGVPARVGRLRGYGNAVVPQVAAEFVMAFMKSTDGA